MVHLARNQGKAMALHTGALLARNDLLLCIDGDALLEADCGRWIARHFRDEEVAAVTGNPRIRNRSTLLGRVQVGEFSSIVGLIKRAQRVFGRLYTVSGVITAFRRSAVFQVAPGAPMPSPRTSTSPGSSSGRGGMCASSPAPSCGS